MLHSFVSALAFLVPFSQAISWGYQFYNGNEFTELSYILTVPPAPAGDVVDNWPSSAPWFFWCGLEPENGGVIQPVLQWGQPSTGGYVNTDASFPYAYALVLWDVPADSTLNDGNYRNSPGIFVAEGDQILLNVSKNNGQWMQTATVISGAAQGQSTYLNVFITDFFKSDLAVEFVCESELHGTQTALWDFDVVFSDLTVTAASADGLEDLCNQHLTTTDGNGLATIQDFKMVNNGLTCLYGSVILSPPPM